jgi:predicted alpha/beta superfamily hydrolase
MGNEWEVDETAEALMENNIIQKILIVGIYNTPERMEEYTPTKDSKGRGGKGPEYAQFIVKELKPFIDSTFKTLKNKQNTAVMGSSLGGLISLYIGWKYSNIFGMTGAVSPSIWWNNRNLLNEIKKSSFDTNCKIWMCMGTKEGNETTSSGIKTSLQNTRDMAVILKEKGFISGKNFAYFEAKNEGHNENAWKKRLHIPLKFFFKTNINK